MRLAALVKRVLFPGRLAVILQQNEWARQQRWGAAGPPSPLSSIPPVRAQR